MLQVYSFLQHHSSSRAAFPGRMEKPLQAGQPWCTHGTRVMEHFPLALQSAGICARPVLWPGHSWKAKLRGSSSGAAQRGLKIQAVLRECFHFTAWQPAPSRVTGHTLPGAGMTPLSLASPHPQALSWEKASQEHPCLITALQLFETASLPAQTDPGGSFNSCSFTIKPGKPKQGDYSWQCFWKCHG